MIIVLLGALQPRAPLQAAAGGPGHGEELLGLFLFAHNS